MKRKFPGNVNLIPGLLLTAGALAFVLLPGNAETKPVFAPENPGIAGTTVTARLVEIRTTIYSERPVTVVDEPVTVIEQTGRVDENTVATYFLEQPDAVIADNPRAINLAIVGDEVYHAERQTDAGNEVNLIELQTKKVVLATHLN